jgi:hypothetical protein
MEKTNLVGERFGRLTVIAPTESKHNRARWVCSCDCGKQCIATGKSLRSGKKQSCNCLRSDVSRQKAAILSANNTLPDGEASFNLLYATYRWHANKRRLLFELTKDDFRILTSGDCFYCGKSPAQVFAGASCKTAYMYNGVDRKINEVGYTLENSVSCCGVCNDMKRTRTVGDFLRACYAIVDHYNRKKSAEMTDSAIQQ